MANESGVPLSKFVIEIVENALRAKTEHHGAFQAMWVERAAASGKSKKTWHTQGDERVRPSHRALSGVTIAIDAVFRNGLSDPFCRCYPSFSVEAKGKI